MSVTPRGSSRARLASAKVAVDEKSVPCVSLASSCGRTVLEKREGRKEGRERWKAGVMISSPDGFVANCSIVGVYFTCNLCQIAHSLNSLCFDSHNRLCTVGETLVLFYKGLVISSSL